MATSVIRYRKRGSLWVPHKFAGGSSPLVNRDALVPGVHQPNDINYVGPYSVTTWEDVFPTGGQNFITITGAGTGGPLGDAHYGKRYWAQVRIQNGLADWAVKFRECQFHGPDPSTLTSNDPGSIRCYGTTPTKFEVHDSLFDPMPWVTERAEANISAYTVGLHGSNYRVYRSEFRNLSDACNIVGPNGNDGAAVTAQETTIQQNWIHGGHYRNNIVPPNDGQPHSDGIQTNTGRNFTIRGNYLGGVRNPTGFWTWPQGGAAPYVGTGYNAGDDCFGAMIMLKQETDQGLSSDIITGVLIELNWFEGGEYGINHASNSNRPNTFGTTTVQDNKFIRRAGALLSRWGEAYQLQSPTPGVPTVLWKSGSGQHIIRANTMTSTYSNNTFTDNGAAVPIANGGP